VVRLLAGQRDIDLLQRIHLGSGSHPTSYSMGTRKKWPGRETDHSPPLTSRLIIRRFVPPLPIYPYGVVLKHGDNITFSKITGPIRALF